jgi:hypothetical protein
VAQTDGLSPDIFNPEGHLKPEVRRPLLVIADDVVRDCLAADLAIIPAWVVLTGSLAGYNYDENSDLDLHIGVDVARFSDPSLVKRLLRYQAKQWNDQDYYLAGHKVEVYFQDVRELHQSPGVYDLSHNTWLRGPDPKFDVPEDVGHAAAALAVRVQALGRQYERWPKEKAAAFLEKARAQWEFIRRMRTRAFKKLDGYRGFGNQVFKALRRNGAIGALLTLIQRVKQDVYTAAGKETTDGQG